MQAGELFRPYRWSSQQADGFGRGEVGRVTAMALLVAVAAVGGCKKTAPPPDPAKAPWLDPKVQTESLKNSDFRIRGVAAYNLGNIGAKAVAAIPELERVARDDPNPKVREHAQEAINKIRAGSK